MTEDMREILEEEDLPEGIERLVTHCKDLVRVSRMEMGSHYEAWDNNLRVYEGYLEKNDDDFEAIEHGEPERMVTPLSYAQVQTFVAFCYLLYTQNEYLFDYRPTGTEDYELREVVNRVVDRDLRKNKFTALLYQLLVDVGRFGLGVIKTAWVEDTAWIEEEVTTVVPGPTTELGTDLTEEVTTTQTREVTTFQGNKIISVNPYHFFPDTRLPMHRFQEGEFCAHDEEFTRKQLRQMERKGEVAGIEHIPELTAKMIETRGPTRLPGATAVTNGKRETLSTVFLTEIQIELVPSEYGLSDSDHPRKYVVVLANDERPIRIEPLGNLHQQFTYDVAEFSPDLQKQIGQSLSDVADNLQATITWMINSRVTSLRRTIDHYLVVDPSGVDMATVEDRSPVIMLRPGASSAGVDRYIKQLQLNDYTATNLADAQLMMEMLQKVTGINENALGQYHSGRRSATEARAVTQGASSRLKVAAGIVWEGCLAPCAGKMITNSRQGMDQDVFARVVGADQVGLFEQFRGTPEDLVQMEDFLIYDSTLPSEKGFIAQSLQEVLSLPPEMLQAANLNFNELLQEILRLRGVRNLERFAVNGSPQANPAGITQILGAIGGAAGDAGAAVGGA